MVRPWIPAFAGMTTMAILCSTTPCPLLNQEGN
jgi:hypothetical protein